MICQGAAARAADDGACAFRAVIDRLDLQPVIGLADQLLERRALQDAIDELAPLVLGRLGEVGGKPQIVGHGGHSVKRSPGANCEVVGRKLPRRGCQAKRLFFASNPYPATARYPRSRGRPAPPRRGGRGSGDRAQSRQAAPARKRARTGEGGAMSVPACRS